MKSVVLIDGNSLMHRAYHAVKFAPVYNDKPVGMVYGFASMLINAIDTFRPDYLVIAFDTKEKTFRHEMDENYKAHRKKADDDFYEQIPLVFECIEHFQIPVLTAPGYEADDIIGTLAKKAESKDLTVKIMSGDQDFLQLVSDKIVFVKPNGKVQDSLLYGSAETEAQLGILPAQVVDYKAIVGDSSDNYKGIPGCGPKAARELLQKYGTLKGIYEHLEDLKPALQKKFEENKKQAFHCRTLAQIKIDTPVELPINKVFQFVPEQTMDFLRKVKFSSLENRYQKLINNYDQKKDKEQKNRSEDSVDNGQLSLF